jgi:hypothetical protein
LLQHGLQRAQVVAGDRLVETGLVGTLVEQFGDVALQVIKGAPHLIGLAVADVARMHEVGAAREDVGLQRDAELPAIVDHLHMMMRNAAGPGVEPQPFVEPALLQRAAHLGKAVAAPERQAASAETARRFQHDAVVPRAIELVGGAQAGHAGTQDRNGLAGAGLLRQSELCGVCGRRLQEFPGRQGLVHGPRAAQPRHGSKQFPACQRHRLFPPLQWRLSGGFRLVRRSFAMALARGEACSSTIGPDPLPLTQAVLTPERKTGLVALAYVTGTGPIERLVNGPP